MKNHSKTVKPSTRTTRGLEKLLGDNLAPVYVARDRKTGSDLGRGVYALDVMRRIFVTAELSGGVPVGPVEKVSVLDALRWTQVVDLKLFLNPSGDLRTDRHGALMMAACDLIDDMKPAR